MQSSNFRIGTSGWNYRDWRGRFYPRDLPSDRWLDYYAQMFDTVEINNTFYRLPDNKTWDRWREQAPSEFLYAVKASRYLTHMRKLSRPAAPLRRFLTRARRLRNHLGPVLYQLPPGWKRNLDRLGDFCTALPRDLMHVIEFRERDWLTNDTFEVLEEHNICLCVHDLIARHPRRVPGPAAYVRFHGVGKRYGGHYSRQRLRQWADWMYEVVASGKQVFAYFNNDIDGAAIRDCTTLRDLMAVRTK